MADAAATFLDALDKHQRAAAAWPFPSDEERRRWFYTPTDHGGVPLAHLRPAQQRLALRLVASGLSRPGFVTVATIMGLENVLDAVEGWTASFERERGRDPSMYYLRIFGEPGAPTWSWRFGGHHVSLQLAVVEGEAWSCTPCFLGADPAAPPGGSRGPWAGAGPLARRAAAVDRHRLGRAPDRHRHRQPSARR
jgi:uncharacterized protein DUF3500